MNYQKIFYWLTVTDNAKTLFITGIIVFGIIAVIATIVNLIAGGEGEENAQNLSRGWIKWSYPFVVLFWSLFIFTPSKKDSLLILAGGGALNYLTQDSTAQQIPKEMSNFVLQELKVMANDAKMELNLYSNKEKILEEAKQLTASELIDKMSIDSTFRNIILNK